jgi:hypothetical protein
MGRRAMEVTAVCKESGGGWTVIVPEIQGVATQAQHLHEVPLKVANVVSRTTGIPADDVRVVFRPTIYELLNPHRVYLPSPYGQWAAPGVKGTCRCGWITASYWMDDNAGEAVGLAYDHVAAATGRQPRVGQTSNLELTVQATSAPYDCQAERPTAYITRRSR